MQEEGMRIGKGSKQNAFLSRSLLFRRINFVQITVECLLKF